MEYLDILDEQGNFTGQKASRDEIHSKGYWHKTAQVLLMNLKGEILIHKRARDKRYYPGMWDVYFGGHALSGEESKVALIREVKEEVNFDLNRNEFIFLFNIKKEDIQNGGSFINNDFAEVYLVKKDFDLKDLVFQKEEIAEARFISQEDLIKSAKKDGEFIPRVREYDLLFDALLKIKK